MFTATIFFSVLLSLAQGAPLPMPAVKQSEQLASRFYNHADPILYHQTPCWENGLEGILRDDVCVLANFDVDAGRYANTYPYRPAYNQGQACSLNGRPGVWQDATCILADVDINLKRDFFPGQECWMNGRRGYFQNDLDVDLDVIANNSPGYLNNGRYPNAPPVAGNPCWLDGRQGLWRDDGLCILADLNLAKRDVVPGRGVVGDVLEALTGYEDCYNCATPFTRHALLPTGEILSAAALVDVDGAEPAHYAHHHNYKRNGLLHQAPDGNEVDGAVRTVTQLLDHSVTKRGLLGVNDLPLVGGADGIERYPYYPNGYQQVQPDVIDSVIDVAADVDVDAGDKPYYGAHHSHNDLLIGLGNHGSLPLKRDILGNGDNTLNVLATIGDVLTPHSHSDVPSHTRYVPASHGTFIPITHSYAESTDLVANVDATVDLDNVNDNTNSYGHGRYAAYPYGSDRRIFGDFVPIPVANGNHGALLGRDLGGLSGVNGLGLNKDGGFPEGLDAAPAVGDLLGAGKTNNLLGNNALSHLL